VRVGDLDVVPVLDGGIVLPTSEPFLGMPAEAWLPHRQFLDADGNVEMALGGFLVRSGDRVVLVDAGLGPRTGPFGSGTARGGALLTSLAEHDVQPEDVTDVVFTHLHFDHVGWATQQGRVVFSNATYRCDERDWAHFVGPDEGATRKLSPLTDRMAFWDRSGPLLPGIDVLLAPGHTPGSGIIVLSSGADRAMLLGDVVHCAVELLDDEWAGMGDVDPALARRTRVALARELEGQDVPVAAAHFPGLQFGRLLLGEGQRRWVVS
jgi:glyoxylase-like metal-dependent hydrolase (beta-lactamase superfamily II)